MADIKEQLQRAKWNQILKTFFHLCLVDNQGVFALQPGLFASNQLMKMSLIWIFLLAKFQKFF